MDTKPAESTSNQDLDDSGCVQDASASDNSYRGQVQLLDLSDDVLLYILKNCSPRDLKALGHTCPRLGALVCDRTLWTRVDARSTPIGQERLSWLLTHCLCAATHELKLTGYANKHSKCLGIQDLHWPVDTGPDVDPCRASPGPGGDIEHFLLRMWYPHLPRFALSPRWPDKEEVASMDQKKTEDNKKTQETEPSTSSKDQPTTGTSENNSASTSEKEKSSFTKEFNNITTDCKGPHFTLTSQLLRKLSMKCSHLTSLALEYCNIDYKCTNICHFPPNLKKLSLRGTMCYNLHLNTSYLNRIQDRLPGLEYLDVSECDWFEPVSLMPLSKLACLRELYMRDCKRLSECVAYASLASRYGFRQLKVMDCRGSPLADSEISALGWLPVLEELYCSPPEDFVSSSEHTHSWKETTATFSELDNWEKEEPEYYKLKSPEPDDVEEDEVLKEDPSVPERPHQDRMGDVLLDRPWWRHERRIIVIQPNASRQFEQLFPRAHPLNAHLGNDEAPAPADPGQNPAPNIQRPSPGQPGSHQEVPMDLGQPSKEQEPAVEARDSIQVGPNDQELGKEAQSPSQVGLKDQEPVPMEQDPPSVASGSINQAPKVVDQTAPVNPGNKDSVPVLGSAEVDQKLPASVQTPAEIDQASKDQGSGLINQAPATSDGEIPTVEKEPAQTQKDPTDQGVPGPSKRPSSDSQPTSSPVKRPRRWMPKGDGPADEEAKGDEAPDPRGPNVHLLHESPFRNLPRVQVFPGPNIPAGQEPVLRAVPLPGFPCLNNLPPGVQVRQHARGIQLFLNNDAEALDLDNDPEFLRIPVDIPRDLRSRDRLFLEHMMHGPYRPQNGGPRPNQDPPPPNVAPECPRLRNQARGEENRARYAEFRRHAEQMDVQRQSTIHIGHAGYHLVSDSAILRFGRADNDNINYVHIGPNGIQAEELRARPDRSSLRVLSATGYRNITDRSLVHLASAAPHITSINFSQTNVTAKGVEIFKAIRPNCEVIFSEYGKSN